MSGRNCTRCGRSLDDAASQEAGTGPICRKLDNALLAKSFDSDVEAARKEWERAKTRFDHAALYSIVSHNDAVKQRIAAVEQELMSIGHGPDWRVVVKSIEWLLSHMEFNAARPFLTSLVRALGYIGLAALWDGDASTGTATVFFGTFVYNAQPMLFLSGPRNKAVKSALRAVGGRQYAPTNIKDCTLKVLVWGIPAAQYARFEHIVRSYYPCHTGLPDAISKAQQAVAVQPQTPAGVVDMARRSVKECRIEAHTENGSLGYRIFTPFNSHFIEALKNNVPHSMRRWNPTIKCWEVQANYLNVARGLIKEHYNTFVAHPTEVEAQPTHTPAPAQEAPKAVPKVTYTSVSALPF